MRIQTISEITADSNIFDVTVINPGNGAGSYWTTIVCTTLSTQRIKSPEGLYRWKIYRWVKARNLRKKHWLSRFVFLLNKFFTFKVREIHDRSKPHCFELFATGGADIIKACKTDSEGKVRFILFYFVYSCLFIFLWLLQVVEGKHSVYRMSAATAEDQLEWIKRLTQSISHNPFYDILVQRKKKALSKS